MQTSWLYLSSIEPEVLVEFEVLHCGNRIFHIFCCCNLDPITFIYELDPYPLKIYRRPNMKFLRRGFQKILIYYRIIENEISEIQCKRKSSLLRYARKYLGECEQQAPLLWLYQQSSVGLI